MEPFVIALDQGTTSSRAILFRRSGEIAARAQHPFRQIYPQPGWVEHDPMEIWSSQYGVMMEVIAQSGVDAGEISAISSNMARINALSAKILDTVINVTENQTITVEIPIGNLTGVSLLMGRGPKVPVQIIVLTSSKVEFSNSIITAGINQTKHQVNLEVIVDIDVLIPWDTASTQVKTEVLIADTVIVGKVPDTYMNVQ